MSDHPQTAERPVDPEVLQKAIQDKLNAHRKDPPHPQMMVDRPVFEDGFWRSVVHDGNGDKRAEDYATILAEVEEEIVDDSGVNVVLVLASE